MKKTVSIVLILLAGLLGLSFAQDTGELPRGGVIQIPLATTPGSLNPILPGELAQNIIGWTLNSALTAINPWTIELEPYLAERWEVSEDLTEWTFYIRDNAKWHDGEKVTAHDVKFTFDKIRDPEEGATNFADFSRVTAIDVLDELTVRITLSAADAWFADRLALGGSEIIPQHVLKEFPLLSDAVAFNSTNPIGSGAFKLKTAVPGSYYELEANDDFFLGRPHLDGIIFKVVPDGNTRVTELLTGQLDYVDIEPVQLNAVRNNPRVTVTTFDSLGYQLLAWNLLKPLFQDVRVREAMMYAVDRRAMAEAVSPGLGYLNDTYIPESIEWITQPDVAFREYDPEKALELLAEAGWTKNASGILEKDGQTFSFNILVDRGDVQREQMGLILQQYFNDIGMQAEYVLAERGGRWLEETQARSFDIRLAAFPMPSIDWAQRLYMTDGPFNSQSYSNARIDELFTAVLGTIDRAEQGALLLEIQEVLYNDPPNAVLLYRERMTASNSRLGNVPPNNIKDAMPYAFMFYLNK